MMQRLFLLLTIAVSTMLAAGCVSSTSYQLKEQESKLLARELQDVKNAQLEEQGKNALLQKELGELKAAAEQLTAQIKALQDENTRLALATQTENLLKTLGERFSELQARIATLQAENLQLQKPAAPQPPTASSEPDPGKPAAPGPVPARE